MKRFVLVDDFIEELNQKHKEEMTDFCLTPLGMENWLNDRAVYPVRLHICSKEAPDPELNELIENMKRLCSYYKESGIAYSQTMQALRYLEQLRLIKGEYARVFFEEGRR